MLVEIATGSFVPEDVLVDRLVADMELTFGRQDAGVEADVGLNVGDGRAVYGLAGQLLVVLDLDPDLGHGPR